MKNLVKKSVLLGLGAVSLTKKKVDKIVAELAKRKLVTTKDGKWLAKQILKELAKNKKRMKKLSRMHAGTLKRKAKSLEARLTKKGRKTAKELLRMAEKELK